MSSTTTDFLEVSEHVSSKLTTNGSIRGKRTSKINIFEAIILNQKRRSATKVIHVFKMVLKAYTFFSYIFSGSECTRFTESSHQGSFRIKNILKI